MTTIQIIGLIMVVLPFVAVISTMFVIMSLDVGSRATLITFACTIITVGCLTLGSFLLANGG